MSKYDPYSCLDLTALQACAPEGDDAEYGDGTAPAAAEGRLLLIVTARGLELVRIPKILH